MRVVLDCNVLISAFLFGGICRSIVEALQTPPFEIVLSPALIEDLLRACSKPKLKKLMTAEIQDEIFSLIHMKALIVEPTTRLSVCRDPSDDAVIECAQAAGARIVVSGDLDLTSLKKFNNISFLTPSEFANRIKL
jgi:putative PIN family toxin of toxin-antitoxin system